MYLLKNQGLQAGFINYCLSSVQNVNFWLNMASKPLPCIQLACKVPQ